MEQLLAHLFGDYFLQTSWMIKWKVRKGYVAAVHALVYGLPFLLLGPSPLALAVIVGTHCYIDGTGLATSLLKAKGVKPNAAYTYPEDGFQYPIYEGNLFLIYVVTDNTLHLLINYCALKWL